jgi:hypothetical protein
MIPRVLLRKSVDTKNAPTKKNLDKYGALQSVFLLQ